MSGRTKRYLRKNVPLWLLAGFVFLGANWLSFRVGEGLAGAVEPWIRVNQALMRGGK